MSVFIRQDIEPVLYELFRSFSWVDDLKMKAWYFKHRRKLQRKHLALLRREKKLDRQRRRRWEAGYVVDHQHHTKAQELARRLDAGVRPGPPRR